MLNVMVTGASGFVGSAIIERLLSEGINLPVAVVRQQRESFLPDCKVLEVGDIQNDFDWKRNLEGINVVIHSAARAHVMYDKAKDPLTEFRRVNVDGTLNLAKQAADTGVHRFIFISSIKVNGETTSLGTPFKPEDVPGPIDPYGISKLEAEHGLFELSQKSRMEVVCVRPTLVYGPGVKGNFATLFQAIQQGVPLPLASVTNNRRSFVALDNLVDLLITCVEHPKAVNQIFFVSDGEDVSTADLIFRIGQALDKPARLINIPLPILKLAAKFFQKTETINRLLASLQVDISETRSLLDWNPPISLDEGLDVMVSG